MSSNPIDRLNLPDLLKVLTFMAIHIDSGRVDLTGKSLARSFSNEKLHNLLARAFAVFDSWPYNFTRFLETTFARAGSIPTRGGLKTNFGRLYTGLYKGLASSEFDFLRGAFESFLAAKWAGELVHPRVLNALPEAFREKMPAGKTEAARVLHASPSSLTRLVEKGFLDGVLDGDKKELLSIERAVLEEFAARKGKFLTAKETAIRLGLDRKAIADLVKHACLTPVLDPSVDGSSSYQFDESGVLDLLSKAEETLCPKISSSGRAISFVRVGRVLSFAGYGIGRLIREVLDGRLPPCGVGSGRGLARLRFLEAGVLKILRDSLREKRGGKLSITAASRLFGIDETGINILIKGNLLPVVSEARDRRLGKLIAMESIDDFLRLHVSSVELARQLKTSPYFVFRHLARHGVSPISGPSVDGGMRYFFKRVDVSSALLQKIRGERKVSKKSGRKSGSRLLSVKVVAAQLGIPDSQVRRLAVTRELPPKLPKGRSMGRGIHLRFTKFDVERYKKRSSEGNDLVVSQKAAEMLGEDLSWFYRRWVRSGRLPKAELHDELGAHFFRKSDVEKLVELKKATITGPEAGKILCMHRTAVLKLTKRKELNPVSGPDVDGFGRYLYLRHEVEAYAKGRNRQPLRSTEKKSGPRKAK
jgi:plasmid maintenance system antidote protein VapI/predicted DNA-binding transcriptional regulator AlpA